MQYNYVIGAAIYTYAQSTYVYEGLQGIHIDVKKCYFVNILY